jgi:hypothetical protein
VTVRVVHCGTGLTGREALRAIIEDPALELIGQYVSTREKVGRDSGELCGLPPTGIIATGDMDEVLALRADCLCYAGSTVGRELEACQEMARFLRAGTNVVTFAVVPLCYPPTSPPELSAIIAPACVDGGTSFYASGTEPGAMSMNVPAALLTMGGVVTGYRMELYAMDLATNYPVEDVLRESMGFGKPDGFAPPRVVSGVVERCWSPDVRFIADLVGFQLDDIRLDWETACAPQDLQTPIGTIRSGTICAYRWQLSGMSGDCPVVTVDYLANIVREAPMPPAWPRLPSGIPGGLVYIVEGRPGFRCVLSVDPLTGERLNGSIPMTALAATNVIPAVVAARPGHLGPTDLPHYATRRATAA